MSLAHTRKHSTFIGHIIVLILAIAIFYFFMNYISNYQINTISKINSKYGVTENSLIPSNYSSYATELEKTNFDKYSKPLIDYVYFYKDAKKIDRYYKYAVFENQCITRITITKIEMQIQERDRLLEEFKKVDSIKLSKIFWNRYIDILENKYEIDELREMARAMPIC